ncbi:hypothetical protein JOC76_002702 [Neobacillus cucumis]|nr:hypothetical protein [Neobacillus cucumis]
MKPSNLQTKHGLILIWTFSGKGAKPEARLGLER